MSFESVKIVVEPATLENVGVTAYPIREFVSVKVTPPSTITSNTWGSITGTLSAQTDLQNALNLKAPLASPTFTGIVTAPRITGRCDGLEVLCKAGLAISAGQVVYVTGASGNNIVIGLARANAEATSSKTIGISESTLANNATGYVITEGLMTVSISAPTANEGDPIWLSPTTAGSMVFGLANKPSAPNHIVYLGVVTRKTGNNVVEIYVKVQNGAELDELSDVAITSAVAGQALMRGATLWENRSLVSADITDATSAATPFTLALRNVDGNCSFNELGASQLNVIDLALIDNIGGQLTLNVNYASSSFGKITAYDIPTGNIYTIPYLEISQTWAGAQTFSSTIIGNINGTSGGFTSPLAGDVTGNQSTTAIAATVVTGKTITGYVSGAGTISATDTILTAINKLNGNTALKAPLASPTFTGTATFSGTAAFTNTARPTAVNVTGTPASTDLITLSDADTRYGTPYNLRVLTDVSSASLSYVNSSDTITLPAGTYFFQGHIVGLTASTTGGINVNFYTNSDTNTTGSSVFQSSSANGTSSTPTMVTRNGAVLFQYLANAFADAPLKACSSIFSGTVTFSTSQTITPRVSQRSVADATNAAILKTGSMVRFIKIA